MSQRWRCFILWLIYIAVGGLGYRFRLGFLSCTEIGSSDLSLSLYNVNVLYIIQCSRQVWNPNPSLTRACPWQCKWAIRDSSWIHKFAVDANHPLGQKTRSFPDPIKPQLFYRFFRFLWQDDWPVSLLPAEDLCVLLSPSVRTHRSKHSVHTDLNTSSMGSGAFHYIQLDFCNLFENNGVLGYLSVLEQMRINFRRIQSQC